MFRGEAMEFGSEASSLSPPLDETLNVVQWNLSITDTTGTTWSTPDWSGIFISEVDLSLLYVAGTRGIVRLDRCGYMYFRDP